MEIKVGYDGRFRRIPTVVNCNWKNIKGGVVFNPENILEETVVEKFIEKLSKFSPHEIENHLNKLE